MPSLPGSGDWYGPSVHNGLPPASEIEFTDEEREQMQDAARVALAEANEARRKLGLEPVKALVPGKPNSPTSCSLAETLKAEGGPDFVHARYDRVSASGVVFYPNEDTQNFQVWFDDGFYPDLVR